MTNTTTRKPNPFTKFATEHKVEMTAVKVPTRPGAQGGPRATDHWRIVLTTDLDSMTTFYSKGPGLRRKRADGAGPFPVTPTIAEVLTSLQSDVSSAWHSSHEEWCSDFGIDEDSREGLATYEACRDCAADLENLLGPGGIDALMEIRCED